jgi:hypothetical protein
MVLLVCACTAESPAPPAPTRGPLKQPTLLSDAQKNVPTFVNEVIDGRTVVLDGGQRVQIALLAPPAECWAAAATAFATKTLLVRPVRITSFSPGEVNLWLEDGTDYAFLAVSEGVLRAQGAAGAIAEAEVVAARENRGLWGLPCNGMDPSSPTGRPPVGGRPTGVPPVGTPPPVGVPPAATSPKLVQPPNPANPVTTTTPPPPVVKPPTPAPPAPTPQCAVSYRITGQWPGGFQGDVKIRNTSRTTINGWTLRWSFGDGQAVTQMWNASSSQRGAAVSATNLDYTKTIAPNGEVSIGFLGSYTNRNSAPGSFTLNGAACSTS